MGTERCTVQRQRRPYDVAIFVAVVLAAELTIFVLPSAGRMILVLLLASLYFPGLALGVPRHDDRKLFEFLVLQGMQAGLSWSTILNKRKNFREAFSNFDARKVAKY